MASLSKLPVLKFKNWCSSCVECLISGRTEWNDEHLTILDADKIFDDESLKGMLAALTFILEKTTKNACPARDLELEMQQLGLPAAPSLAISAVDVEEGGNGKVYIMNMRSSNQENISIALNDEKLNYLVQELSRAMDIIRPFIRNTVGDTH